VAAHRRPAKAAGFKSEWWPASSRNAGRHQIGIPGRFASESAPAVVHRVTKHLQQVIESDHFRVKRTMPKVGGFRSFATARRTIAGFEAMLWLRKSLGFAGEWTVRRQNELLQLRFGLQKVNEA